MVRFFVLAAMLVSVLAAAIGCDESNDEVIVVVPPLGIRETYPIDADSTNSADDYFGVVDLTVTFDRQTSASLISQALHPRPVADGTFSTVNRRTWTLNDVELAADAGTYYWLIDGVRMPEPFVLKVRTQKTSRLTGFDGRIESLAPSKVDPKGTVVFALPTNTQFNPLDPSSFDASEAIAVAVAFSPDDFDDAREDYQLRYLKFGSYYYVVAVNDTNDDLIYDPTVDWWGYYRVEGSIAAVGAGTLFAEPGVTPQFNSVVDIRLQSPPAPAE